MRFELEDGPHDLLRYRPLLLFDVPTFVVEPWPKTNLLFLSRYELVFHGEIERFFQPWMFYERGEDFLEFAIPGKMLGQDFNDPGANSFGVEQRCRFNI